MTDECSPLQMMISSPGRRPMPERTILIPSVVFCWTETSSLPATMRAANAVRERRKAARRRSCVGGAVGPSASTWESVLDGADHRERRRALPAAVEIDVFARSRDLGADRLDVNCGRQARGPSPGRDERGRLLLHLLCGCALSGLAGLRRLRTGRLRGCRFLLARRPYLRGRLQRRYRSVVAKEQP